ncbi:poly(R)-hydroxyalkanoic acid synthase subunit PhaE [Cytobacillus sp. Hz8]|uniref:poly(R)-hydroxyalkanoic acid synthase subunit PhaE n=1 Tax=Cytobacillus sp. Hz8 TaxID=3347168 RepID=UPI0035E29CE3
MADQKVLDPFKVWKDIYQQTEAKWNEAIHETMQKEAFAEWMGQVQSAYLQYQELVQKTTENYLKQISVPTRDEISSVASLIINLEEKVDNLDQKIDDELDSLSANEEITKLKSSISKLDKKLDNILKVVQQLETAPSAQPVVEESKGENVK